MMAFFRKRMGYGFLVMFGVVILVFFLFKGFGDPARLLLGQTADAATQENIRKELYLDQPVWKQFLFYLNDLSPISFYNEAVAKSRGLHGMPIGKEIKAVVKFPYLSRSFQSKKEVWDILL